VVAEAEDSRSAFDAAVEHTPNIVLMDLSLPPPGGIETTQRVKREVPSAGIIVLAVNEDEDQLFDAIRAGAAAFILKDVGPDDLVTIIRRVGNGEYLINDKVFAKPSVASRVLNDLRELSVY
jgi:DNA-binding NarL/FixJ family response regulator